VFDTTVVGLGGDGPKHVTATVTEKRAPTDESVRLLREMEAASEASVVAAGRLSHNSLSGSWYIFQDSMTLRARAKYVYKLNGEDITGEVELDHRDLAQLGVHAMLEKVCDAVCDAVCRRLAESITLDAYATMINDHGS